jgi:hypothetical protein
MKEVITFLTDSKLFENQCKFPQSDTLFLYDFKVINSSIIFSYK